MIDRVEVLQDGASAIYGSDAIAGVVNIITKNAKRLRRERAAQRLLEASDGFTQNYQLSWGNGSDGPLQVVVGGDYIKQKGVFAGDRAISAFPSPYANCLLAWEWRLFELHPERPLYRYGLSANGGDERLLINAPTSTPTIANFRRLHQQRTRHDRFNFAPYNYMQIPLERYGVFGSVTYDFTPNVHLSVKGLGTGASRATRPRPCRSESVRTQEITPVLDATIHRRAPISTTRSA